LECSGAILAQALRMARTKKRGKTKTEVRRTLGSKKELVVNNNARKKEAAMPEAFDVA